MAKRLLSLQRFEEAEQLVRLGLARAPDHPALLEQFAFCAHNSGRYKEALDRWSRLCALTPDAMMPWCGVAANARALLRRDEAEAAIAEAMRRFPGEAVVVGEAARVAESRGDHRTAADLWHQILAHPAADAHWHKEYAKNLLHLGLYDEVAEVLAALPAPCDEPAARRAAMAWGEIAAEAAELDRARLATFLGEAERRYGDEAYAVPHVAGATTRLAEARDALALRLAQSPEDATARECRVRVLLRSDLVDEAECELETGLRKAPAHDGLLALRGLVALRKQDWEQAHALLAAEAEKRPGDFAAAAMAGRVRWQQHIEHPGRGDGARVPITPELCDDPEVRRLLLTFESIGADCEFGLVQRRYGAEPLGLLRWTDTDVPSLLVALAARFDGVGEPANTELTIGPIGEIYVRDTRWHLAMHTFLFETEVSLETLRPKMCRRAAWLRDKLLEDLRAGQKTLVFKSDLVERGELVALHDALLQLGSARLVNIRSAAAPALCPAPDAGPVGAIRPGLFVGRLSRLSELMDIAFDEWIDVCRAVERLRDTPIGVPLRAGLPPAA